MQALPQYPVVLWVLDTWQTDLHCKDHGGLETRVERAAADVIGASKGIETTCLHLLVGLPPLLLWQLPSVCQ